MPNQPLQPLPADQPVAVPHGHTGHDRFDVTPMAPLAARSRSMNDVVLFLWSTMIMSTPFLMYAVEAFGLRWNPERIVMVFLMAAISVKVICNPRTAFPTPVVFMVCAMMLSLILNQLNQHLDRGLYKAGLLPAMQAYFVFFVTFMLCREHPSARLMFVKAMAVVGVWFLLFSVYSVYKLFILHDVIADIPFRAFIPIKLAEASSHMEMITRISRRASLPYSTSPFLAFIAGLLGTFLIYCGAVRNSKRLTLLGIAQLVVVFLTFSRSGLFASVFAMTILGCLAFYLRSDHRLRIHGLLTWLFISGVIMLVIIVGYQQLVPQEATRLTAKVESSTNYGHILIRQMALNHFIDSPWHIQLFGEGLGNFRRVLYAVHGHMTYSTMLIERGVIGLVLAFSFLFVMPIVFMFRLVNRCGNATVDVLGLTLTVQIGVGLLFYEYHNITNLWFFLGYLASLAWPLENTVDERVCFGLE